VGLLAALGAAVPGRALPPPGPPVVWACDRDGQALVGLDVDGRRSARRAVPWPLEVAVGRVGDPWVVAAPGPGPRSARLLIRSAAEPDSGSVLHLEGASGLRCDASGAAYLLAGRGELRSLGRVRAGHGLEALCPAPGATHWAPLDRGFLLAGPDGLALHGASDPSRPRVAFRPWRDGEFCEGLEPARGGGAWILTRDGTHRRLRRVDAELRTLAAHSWPLPRGPAVPGVLVERGGLSPWVIEARGPRLEGRPCGGPGPSPWPRPLGAGAALHGRLWVAAPGACLLLDERLRPVWGQGGFRRIVGLVAVPP